MPRVAISLYRVTISHHIAVDGLGVCAQPLERLERREESFQITPSTWHSQYDDHGGGDYSDDDDNNDDDSDDDADDDDSDDGDDDDQAGNGVAEHGLGIPGSVKMGGSFRLVIIIIIIIIIVIIAVIIIIVKMIVTMMGSVKRGCKLM